MQGVKQTNYELEGWNFYFKEGFLATTPVIDQMVERCKLMRSPTIIFADNICHISNSVQKVSLTFSAEHALRLINFQERDRLFAAKDSANAISYIPQKLQVRHADKWKNVDMPKDVEISKVTETSDCFFLTPSKGHVEGILRVEKVAENVIPVHKLGPQNQMKFYSQGSLYEDELDDNGLIQYEYKFRAMTDCWFALVRCYARIDEVLILLMDTRIYWEHGWNKIARQFTVKKTSWTALKTNNLDQGWMLNPNQSHIIYPFLQEILVDNQYLHFK